MWQKTFMVEGLPWGADFNYKGKKHQEELRYYQLQREAHQLDEKIRQDPLLAKNVTYLQAMLSWLDDTPDGMDEMQKLEHLGILCERPSYLFLSAVPSATILPSKPLTTVEKYEKFSGKMNAFYASLDQYINELSICYRYMQRATLRLNRSCDEVRDTLELQFEAIQKDINDCYRSYFHFFQALGLRFNTQEPPQMKDTNLLGHCFGNPYLWPFAPVMLLRDMQYQLLGKKKYKKAELFRINSTMLMDVYHWESEKQHENYERFTYACMLDLKRILLRYAKQIKATNPWMTLTLNKFEEECAAKNGLPRYMMTAFEISSSIRWNQECYRYHGPPLLVPVYDCEYIALKLARLYQLSDEALKSLMHVLPTIFSERCNVAEQLDERILSVECLTPTIQSIYTLLNPAQHEKVNRNLDDLKRAISQLKKEKWFATLPSTKQQNARIQRAISSVAELKDLTNHALLLCGAAEPCPKNEQFLPPFIKRQMKKLKKVCNTYRKPKFICSLLGIEKYPLEEEIKQKIKDTGIRKNIKQVLYAQESSWEQARFFLEKYVIGVMDRLGTSEIVKKVQRDALENDYPELFQCVDHWKYDEAIWDAVLYTLFDCLLKHAFYQIRVAVLTRFYEYSRQYCIAAVKGESVTKVGIS